MAYGSGCNTAVKKETKYEDKNRERFWRETTYAANFKPKNWEKFEEHRQIDDQIMTKYSNRVPKAQKPGSVDRTKHRRDYEQFKHSQSQDRKIKHRYDYNNAMCSTGDAFYKPDSTTGNYMEYHYHHLGRPGRRMIVDKVIKYKYPPQIGTNYQKEHANFNSTKAVGRNNTGEPFNVEKEHKIINPHKVEKLTINRIDYQPYTIQPREPKKLKAPSPQQFIPAKSSYQSDFQNWGPNEIIHEKDPQYPYYSLPFKGNSWYARTFWGGSNDGRSGRGIPFGFDAIKQQYNAKNAPHHGYSVGGGPQMYDGNTPNKKNTYLATQANMGKSATNLKPFLGATGMSYHFETMNQHNFKNYHIKHRPKSWKPVAEAIRTVSNPQHFNTKNKQEYKFKVPKPLAVDMIPYP